MRENGLHWAWRLPPTHQFASVIPLLLSALFVLSASSLAAPVSEPGALFQSAAGECPGSCLIWPDPLPEQFTVTIVFSWQPREQGDGIWAIGLSELPDGPPTLIALALAVEQPVSWFGPMATVRIISDAGALGPMATRVEPLGAFDAATVREIFETGSSTILRPGERYVATLSMDRTTGAASIRLATEAGTEIVAGHFRVSPQQGAVYAGVGGFGRTPLSGGQTGSAASAAAVRAPEVRDVHVRAGFERIGGPLVLRGRTVLLNVTDENGRDVRSTVVHADSSLMVQVFGAPARVPGRYALYTDSPGAGRTELWTGLPVNDAEPVSVPVAQLRPDRYRLVLAYVEPDFELELAGMDLDVTAATVEAYLRPGGEPAGYGGAQARNSQPRTGELVLRSDRGLEDLYIEVTAHPAGSEGSGAATGIPGGVPVWSGHVSLEAGETLTIPVQWTIAPPFEYEIAYSHRERIVLTQTGRRVPSDHPFLLVRQDQYEELRRRASAQPWSDMKREAEGVVARQAYPAGADIRTRALALRDIISAATLLYILEPANRQRNLAVLESSFDLLPQISRYRAPDPASWDANVPVANALFSAILALDVVYYDLDPARRHRVEETIDSLVSENNQESWTLSAYALRGTWALFKGDRRSFERYKALYKSVLYGALTGDGIFNEGTGYAVARFSNPDREQKHLFMDVLEFTGEDRFYADPVIGRFYEWLFGHALAPDGRPFTFGDTSPIASLLDEPAGAALYRAHRFSEAAGGYAAWWAGRMKRPGSFAAYVLADRAPEPARPMASLIAPDGGAWFAHPGGEDRDWLAGALWNPKSSGGHSHKDVNAVHLAAYGEHLVVNSGYRGWNQGGSGFTWSYLHDRAISSNTVLIDGADHRLKHGAGVPAGFIGDRLMFARGNSGNALQDGVHVRDFLFVPPGEGAGGYWILVDRVNSGGRMSVALHPYSSAYTSVAPSREYEWTVGGAGVTIFLATPPADVQLRDGLLAGFGRSIVGKYLLAEYTAEREPGTKQALTVIFPHDSAHPKAALERLAGDGYSGARIAHMGGVVKDLALEAAGAGPVEVEDVRFTANAALVRRRGAELHFFFVADGTQFRVDGTDQGFASDEPVTLLVEGDRGWIVSPGAEVTFYGAGLSGVLLERDAGDGAGDAAAAGAGDEAGHMAGREAPAAEAGPGWIRVSVPPGTHSFELVR